MDQLTTIADRQSTIIQPEIIEQIIVNKLIIKTYIVILVVLKPLTAHCKGNRSFVFMILSPTVPETR